MFKLKWKNLCVILSLAIVASMIISTVIKSSAKEVELDEPSNIQNENTTTNTTPETDFTTDDLRLSLGENKLVELHSLDKLQKYFDSLSSTPAAYDNSQSKYFPPIGNQGDLGSCNSWASVYYQMTYSINKALNRPANCDANIMSPNFVYNLTNSGQNTGTYYTDVLKILSDIGSVSIETIPTVSKSSDTALQTIHASNKDIYMEASKYRVKEYYTIGTANNRDLYHSEYTNDDIQAIKKALSMGEILTMSTVTTRWDIDKINSKYGDTNKTYSGQQIITRVSGTKPGGHRMTIVGYDDNICVDINENGTIEAAEKGAFKIANSWGANWGNNGYIWMTYDAVKVKSEADERELNNSERICGMHSIVGYSVDVNNYDDDCYLVLNMQTYNLQSLELVITATDCNNKKYIYEPAPFSNAMNSGMGPHPFSQEPEGSRGEIYIDLSKVVDGLTKDNINKYNWSFTLTNRSTDTFVALSNAKFYFKSNNTYSEALPNSSLVLDNMMHTINVINNY